MCLGICKSVADYWKKYKGWKPQNTTISKLYTWWPEENKRSGNSGLGRTHWCPVGEEKAACLCPGPRWMRQECIELNLFMRTPILTFQGAPVDWWGQEGWAGGGGAHVWGLTNPSLVKLYFDYWSQQQCLEGGPAILLWQKEARKCRLSSSCTFLA